LSTPPFLNAHNATAPKFACVLAPRPNHVESFPAMTACIRILCFARLATKISLFLQLFIYSSPPPAFVKFSARLFFFPCTDESSCLILTRLISRSGSASSSPPRKLHPNQHRRHQAPHEVLAGVVDCPHGESFQTALALPILAKCLKRVKLTLLEPGSCCVALLALPFVLLRGIS